MGNFFSHWDIPYLPIKSRPDSSWRGTERKREHRGSTVTQWLSEQMRRSHRLKMPHCIIEPEVLPLYWLSMLQNMLHIAYSFYRVFWTTQMSWFGIATSSLQQRAITNELRVWGIHEVIKSSFFDETKEKKQKFRLTFSTLFTSSKGKLCCPSWHPLLAWQRKSKRARLGVAAGSGVGSCLLDEIETVGYACVFWW